MIPEYPGFFSEAGSQWRTTYYQGLLIEAWEFKIGSWLIFCHEKNGPGVIGDEFFDGTWEELYLAIPLIILGGT